MENAEEECSFGLLLVADDAVKAAAHTARHKITVKPLLETAWNLEWPWSAADDAASTALSFSFYK